MIFKKIIEEITFFGGIAFYLFILLWFLMNGKINYFLVFVFALLIIYFITLIIRILYFKQRPQKIVYKSFIEKMDASSFPSIHAARTTFIFIFLIFFVKTVFLLKISFFILMILIFYSRVYLKKHDLADIIGGIILGIISSVVLLMI